MNLPSARDARARGNPGNERRILPHGVDLELFENATAWREAWAGLRDPGTLPSGRGVPVKRTIEYARGNALENRTRSLRSVDEVSSEREKSDLNRKRAETELVEDCEGLSPKMSGKLKRLALTEESGP